MRNLVDTHEHPAAVKIMLFENECCCAINHAACLMLVLIEFMMRNMDDEYEDAVTTLLLF
jgi:hypothetical protein